MLRRPIYEKNDRAPLAVVRIARGAAGLLPLVLLGAVPSAIAASPIVIRDYSFLNSVYAKANAKIIKIWPFSVPEELLPSNWLDHALLGENVVTAISELYSEATRFVEFAEEMQGKPADALSKFGGGVGDEPDPGINTFREMNESLGKSAKDLLSLLATWENSAGRPKPPRTPRGGNDSAALLVSPAPVLAIIAKATGEFGQTYIKQPFLAGKVARARRAAAIMVGIVMSMFLLAIGCLIWLTRL